MHSSEVKQSWFLTHLLTRVSLSATEMWSHFVTHDFNQIKKLKRTSATYYYIGICCGYDHAMVIVWLMRLIWGGCLQYVITNPIFHTHRHRQVHQYDTVDPGMWNHRDIYSPGTHFHPECIAGLDSSNLSYTDIYLRVESNYLKHDATPEMPQFHRRITKLRALF